MSENYRQKICEIKQLVGTNSGALRCSGLREQHKTKGKPLIHDRFRKKEAVSSCGAAREPGFYPFVTLHAPQNKSENQSQFAPVDTDFGRSM